MKWLALVSLLASCTEKPKAAPAPLPKPVPFEPLTAERISVDASADADPTYTVKPFPFGGASPPAAGLRINVSGSRLTVDTQALSLESLKSRVSPQRVVVLSFDEETYLAQTLELLAVLNDAGTQVWLQSPDVPALAWPVKLRDEASFGRWLDEPIAGKLRIVHRADGFELQTNMGKLAGGDAKGPTVPTRGGAFDLVTLQKGLDRVKRRFSEADEVCFMPSYAMALNDATRAVATNWLAKDKVIFAGACLVFPRPSTDAG